MNFIHRKTTNKFQWQAYKELELIPDFLPYPQVNKPSFAFGLEEVWRLLIIALTQELVYEQQVEYLERCWMLDVFEPDNAAITNMLHRLWALME
jgi:hypothetical protein